MPLSEEELRLLEQMERALVEEDPKLASTLRGTSLRRSARRRAILAGLVFVVGVAVLMTGAIAQLWYVGIVGSGATVPPQQSWRTQVVSLVWEAGAWKVSSFASSPGPTPPLTSGEVAQEPGDLFSAMPRFEEFDRALP